MATGGGLTTPKAQTKKKEKEKKKKRKIVGLWGSDHPQWP
jgi:hypothetical protein